MTVSLWTRLRFGKMQNTINTFEKTATIEFPGGIQLQFVQSSLFFPPNVKGRRMKPLNRGSYFCSDGVFGQKDGVRFIINESLLESQNLRFR